MHGQNSHQQWKTQAYNHDQRYNKIDQYKDNALDDDLNFDDDFKVKEDQAENVEDIGEIDDKFPGKIKKRCLYWPNCKSEECQYIHPTEDCPKFPKCSFGAQCFYVHPTIVCKYGYYCQRPNCSYEHPQGSQMQEMMQYGGGYQNYQQYGQSPFVQQPYCKE